MPDPQTNFDLHIEKLVYGGEGLGRREGQVVLVPFVLPGERVTVAPEPERGGVLRARLAGLAEPVPGRVNPDCPYFTRCGGCHYQHASYELQLEVKRSILVDTLRRVGKIEAAPGATVVGEPWGYRNRMQFHLARGLIGLREARSHRICPVERCPISSPRINATLTTLREMIRDPRWPRFVRSIELFSNETEVQLNVLDADRPVARRFFDWCAERIPGAAAGTLDYPAAWFTYRVWNRSFFQTNRFLADALAAEALATAEGERAVDLYAGVGLFTLPLARRCGQVTAIESGAGAVRDLQFNSERAGVPVRIEHATAEMFLQRLSDSPDFVLADPPRSGLGKEVVRRLAELRPPRLTIVACDPATLARDLAALVAAGYRVERLALVDLFPQTFHIETVAHLRRDYAITGTSPDSMIR